MTLRLVTDNDGPLDDLSAVPAHLRQIATAIERGEYGDVQMAVVLLETGDVLSVGDDEATHIEMMGLFEAAKLQTFANMVTEDD
jgi:hypothetical protein